MKKILSAALALVCVWFATPARAALPYDYTQLEYIESTGTQYIDTNIPNSDKLKSWIDFSDVSAEQGTLFGGTTGVNGIEFAGNTYGWMARLKDKAFVNTEIRNNTTFSDTITLTQNSITSKNFQSSWRLRADTNSISGTMRVFVRVKGNLHGYKLWTNDELVFDGIPAKRNSDGAIGLYDKVTGNLFISKGSESFVAGPETCDGTVVNYTSATGTGVQNGTPTPDNPIEPVFYQQGNMVLRKVGDYADTYDATTGKITRRVGVAVLDGTENWGVSSGYFSISDAAINWGYQKNVAGIATVFPFFTSANAFLAADNGFMLANGFNVRPYGYQFNSSGLTAWTNYLAAQYAAGTPVTIYYPLAEETTEDWTETSYCETPIKIATTKYNETAFSPLNTALQNAISVVDSVVTQTITQAGRIADLQTQKQTRPNDIADDNEKCPAGKKCLLVEDASGVPHWYEIVTSRLPDGYTELEYIESTGTQYIKLPSFPNASNINVTADVLQTNGTHEQIFFSIDSVQTLYTSSGSWRTWKSGDNNVTLTNTSSRHLFDIKTTRSGVKYYIDGIQNTNVSATFYTSEVFSAKILFLGARTATTGAGYFWQGRIYSFNSECDGVVCMNLVPALNPDGKIGMYDLVGGRFYENAGDGEFIGGQPVFN